MLMMMIILPKEKKNYVAVGHPGGLFVACGLNVVHAQQWWDSDDSFDTTATCAE